jgi:hypothetical protein
MIFRRCFELVVVATVSVNALNLCAQTMRDAEMDTGTAITSVTRLHGPRHPAPPYGAIDGTADLGVTLDVSLAPDLASEEIGNQLQSGRAGGYTQLRGLNSLSLAPGSLQGKNPQGVIGPASAANAAAVQTPLTPTQTSSTATQPPSTPTLQSAHSSARSTSPHLLPAAGNKSQSGSGPNVPPASKIGGPQAPGGVDSRSNGSGHSGSLPDLPSSRSHKPVPGTPSVSSRSHRTPAGAVSISPDSRESVSDASPDDYTSKDDTASTESNATSADQQERAGFFEALNDPFADQLENPFPVSQKHFGMERACGDACPSAKSTRTPENDNSDTSESTPSVGPTARNPLRLYGGVPRSSLEHGAGGLFREGGAQSGLQKRGPLKGLKGREQMLSDSVSAARRESSD